jgi:acyl-CoA:acyl-CoA alkyltransferase
MLYQNVCLEAIAYTLPEEVVTSAEIEARLEPLYTRLRLPEGRLELMTGIAQRRFWPRGMAPSQMSIETAQKAIRIADIDRTHFGALVHGSVCRDFLEPATACGVHHRLALPDRCAVYDVSNACLGLLNGMVQVANMIELGQIRAGVVVGTESSRALVEATIHHLNADTSLSRHAIKAAFASLTIGSGSAAIVLCDRELSRTGNRLLGGVMQTATQHCKLCQGGHSVKDLPSPSGRGAGAEGVADVSAPLMWTDSEALMREGVAAAQEVFGDFLEAMEWAADDIHKTFCHQVGRAHQRLLFESLGLEPQIDYSTLEYLGNTGSVALPITAAVGIENGHLCKNDHVALLGIGSGINVIMLGVEWQRSLAEKGGVHSAPHIHRGSVPSGR